MLSAVQGVSFAGPAACMLTCGVLTPAAVSSQLITGTLVALLSSRLCVRLLGSRGPVLQPSGET